MRGAVRHENVLTAAIAGAFGAAGGALATGAMFLAAWVDLAVSGVPFASWSAVTQVAFGGNAVELLGLTGPALHFAHGTLLGVVFGVVFELVRYAPSRPVAIATIGIPLGVVLWAGVLDLSSPARSDVGAGPPLLLSLAMHLIFAVVLAAVMATVVPRIRNRWGTGADPETAGVASSASDLADGTIRDT